MTCRGLNYIKVDAKSLMENNHAGFFCELFQLKFFFGQAQA